MHENIGRSQEGGTSLLCYGPLIEQCDFENLGKDDMDLKWWVVMFFQGADGIVMHVWYAATTLALVKRNNYG